MITIWFQKVLVVKTKTNSWQISKTKTAQNTFISSRKSVKLSQTLKLQVDAYINNIDRSDMCLLDSLAKKFILRYSNAHD